MMSSQKSLFVIGGGVLAAAIGVFYLSDKTKKSKTSQPQTVSRSSLQSQAPLSEIPTSISQKYGLDIGNRSNYQQDKDASDSLKESKNILNQHFTTNLLPGFRLPAQLDADNFNKVKAPPIITSVLVLNLFKKALKEYLYSIHDKLTQLKKKGVRIAANNTQVTAALKNVNLESIREKILVKEGFDGFEDAPSQVFAEALQKYSKEDPDEFNKKLKKLQDQTAKVMKSLMGVSKNAVYLIEALGDHLVVGSEGMSHSRVKSLQASLVLEQITELSAEDEADN